MFFASRLVKQLVNQVALVGLTASAFACGADRFIVIGTAKAPSTSGYVEVDDDDLIIHMEHLHPPSELGTGVTSYVVWFDGHAGAPERAGPLRYNPDDRTGVLTAHSPFRKLTVKITAETSTTPSAPSELVVASEEVALDD